MRDEERAAGLELARALQARRVSQLFQLSRLDQEQVTEMVRSCLVASTVADEVVDLAARAEGVSFLIEELLAVAVTSGALVADGDSWALSTAVGPIVPLTFSESMRRRLAALGERPRAVLLAAAVLGRSFDWSLLPATTGLGQEDVLAALHAAVDTQISRSTRASPRAAGGARGPPGGGEEPRRGPGGAGHGRRGRGPSQAAPTGGTRKMADVSVSKR